MAAPSDPGLPAGPADAHQPYIPAGKSVAELTVRAIVLGIVLSVVLAAANAYLGLFAGMTVSASIPAAVVSMAVLRLLRRGTILENNLVQTAASAGEALVAGVVFTIPAMVIGAYWGNFHYWETSLIACMGGLLGVFFTIPLRRALIIEQPLKFPEGVATAEVLKIGETGGSGVRPLLVGGILGALFKLFGGGFRVWQETLMRGASVGGNAATIGFNFSPALIAVGYIVGLNIAVLVMLGAAINWWVAIPIYIGVHHVDVSGGALAAASNVWGEQTRYLGVGAMLVGGLWALVRMRKSLVQGVRSGMDAYRRMRDHGAGAVLRTDRDLPMQWILAGVAITVLPLIALFYHFTHVFWVSAVMAVLMVIAGFLFSAVASYMAGLVGSSNNPISGVTIATMLTTSLVLLLLLGEGNTIGPVAAILIGACVCCAAAIGGDNLQDLKTGHIVGATPWKQQVMQAVGTVSAAFAIAPVLTLLHTAYGIGPTPGTMSAPPAREMLAELRPVAPEAVGLAEAAVEVGPAATKLLGQPRLEAPQATLANAVSGVARGVSHSGLPWIMIFLGMGVAVLIILFDLFLESRGSAVRAPVLAVAVGIYLPFHLSPPIFVGGLLAWAAARWRGSESDTKADEQGGLLVSAGLITGEALAGIALAIPIAAAGDAGVLQLIPGGTSVAGVLGPGEPWLGIALTAGVAWVVYRFATARRRG